MILSFDTATKYCSVALKTAEGVFSLQEAAPLGHSQRLMPMIEELLASQEVHVKDLTAIVCGLGPGSFTGIRIGLATAFGLRRALSIPLYGVSSLEARLRFQKSGTRIALIDARRNRVYAKVAGERKRPEANLPFPELLQELAQIPGELYFSGENIEGFLEQAKALGDRVHEVIFRDYAAALIEAYLDGKATEDIRPHYLRETQAEALKRGVQLD